MYYFKCECNPDCQEKSDDLGKDYCRLLDKKWVTKKHIKPEDVIIKEFKGGYIIKHEEF